MYHPRVFKKNVEHVEPEHIVTEVPKKQIKIPENTLYEEPLVAHKKPRKNYITVFGFSPENQDNVVKKIKEVCKVDKIDYGKNWIRVYCLSGAQELIKLNTSIINGEIIGVYRADTNKVIEDKDIYIKKEGLFKKIIVYLFGE